jgi:hypothetical protein
MPELLICRNGTNSSEIVREIVGAQFRSLRHTLRFARVRGTTLAYVEKVRPQFSPSTEKLSGNLINTCMDPQSAYVQHALRFLAAANEVQAKSAASRQSLASIHKHMMETGVSQLTDKHFVKSLSVVNWVGFRRKLISLKRTTFLRAARFAIVARPPIAKVN